MSQTADVPPLGQQPDEGLPGDVSVFFDEDLTLIILTGEIDLSLGADLEYAGRDAVDRGMPTRVDMRRVSFIDSIGVGFLSRLVVAGREAGWRPLVVDPSRRVEETLALSGLTPLIDIMASVPVGPGSEARGARGSSAPALGTRRRSKSS